jgi:ribosomal protein S18 acetylase RimI-like enzyme
VRRRGRTLIQLAIHILTSDDLEAANHLCIAAYASTREHRSELLHYLDIQPDGWFLVTSNGTPVGFGGTVNYGAFAYIGLVAVDPLYQRQGIGQTLMQHLLTWLHERQCPCALLDATQAGAPLYTRLGFQDVGTTLAFRLETLPVPHAPLLSITPLRIDDFSELVDFDTRRFGASRRAVFSAYFATYPDRFLVTRGKQGQITGYLLAQSQSIGPWLAETPGEALDLLHAALCLPFNGPPLILVPEENKAALAIVQGVGFQQTRSFRHMRRGETPGLPQREQIYALTSAALG